MSSPKVVMVVHHRYPLDPRVLREARIAAERGHEVEVVALRGEGEAAREFVDGVRVFRVPISHARAAGALRMVAEYVGFAIASAWIVARRAGRGDIVHVHAPPDFLILAGLLPKLRGAKLVLDIHDLSPLLFGERFGSGWIGRALVAVLQVVQRISCGLADRVVTVHRPYVLELGSLGVAQGKLRTIMNAADENLIAQALASKPEREADAFTVAYHGTITPAYGVGLLVEALGLAAPSLPQLRGLILGDGDALDELRSRACELGIEDRIEFSGRYLPVPEALRRVAAADCGVVPNPRSELNRLTLSTKLLEYVALGVPAVVARLETLAAHFGDDEVTFFEPGDPEALAAAIRTVSENPAEAAAKAGRAHERSREYSWERARDGYGAVLEELRAAQDR